MSRTRSHVYCLSVPVLAALAGGCTQAPHEEHTSLLRRTVLDAMAREMRDAPPVGTGGGSAPMAPRTAGVETLGLGPDILKKLEETSGPGSYTAFQPPMSQALDGSAQKVVPINMMRAVYTTANNNLTLQFARLVPAIGQARTAEAEAAFDWTLFANTQFQNQNNATVRTTGFPAGPVLNESTEYSGTLGVRRRMESGGAVVFQTQAVHNDLDSPGTFPSPNPGNSVNVVAQVDQPLMRGFGSDVALAEVRLSVNAERDNTQQLKATLIEQLVDAETSYWQLVRASGELKIATRLLDRGSEVSDTLKKRQQTAKDVRASQFSDAVATVEARRADVIRAENSYRLASDRLKGIMNDPDLTVGSEVMLAPVDVPVTEPLAFTLRDIVTTALEHRPEVQRALLAISDARIRRQLADNARLPALDLRLQTRVSELRDGPDTAYQHLTDLNFVDYIVGLNYEQPIGNRAAEAGFRGRELELMQARTTYREVVQRILLDVKAALRSVVANYALIEQTHKSRVSAAENVRTLDVEERTIQLLTPEFLDLKLRRQQALAAAEAQELAALTEYNASIARLYGSMGTSLEHNRIRFDIPDAEAPVPMPAEVPPSSNPPTTGNP